MTHTPGTLIRFDVGNTVNVILSWDDDFPYTLYSNSSVKQILIKAAVSLMHPTVLYEQM